MTDATDDDALARAAKEAVEGSLREMKMVTDRVERLKYHLKSAADSLRDRRPNAEETDPCRQFVTDVDQFVARVDDIFKRQRKALKTFNIVLFGRTGVGKSSLISAMTRSNGASVSQGESDWTTAVEPVNWHACRLYDTPGINGWGRTGRREDLEKRAREAVEIADVVLVCFDSQSQQASEFEKLAAWVHSYRKPVIAVLNARNARWRLPPRVKVGSARAQLSRAVREHAGNVRDELARIGLTSVPVVALSLKRALFARAELPFEGPDGSSLEKQRREFGADALERWSGYSTLEGLLVRAVCSYAVRLRIGALNDQLRGVMSGIDRALRDQQDEVRQTAETTEQLVTDLLRVLGYPPEGDSKLRKPLIDEKGRDLLAELERSRGGRFDVSVKGEYDGYVSDRLDAELGALRKRSIGEAEKCVNGSFDRREDLSDEELRKRCFDEAEMNAKAESVLQDGARYLERRIKFAFRETELDLNVLSSWAATTVEGTAGSGWMHGTWALRSAGLAGGAATVVGGLSVLGAIVLFSNPVGWVIMTAGSIASGIFFWLSHKTRKEADRERLDKRRQALARVRRNVHDVYDEFKKKASEQARSLAREASRHALRPAVDLALEYRVLQGTCSSLREKFSTLSGDLTSTVDPQSLLSKAATTIERAAWPERSDAGVRHWLGEDWIDDPVGLESAHGSTDAGRTKAYDPTMLERLFGGVSDTFHRIFHRSSDDVAPGSGHAWLKTAWERCDGDPDLREALSELQAIAEEGRPRIHLVGNYSTGKTSFIKRLLIDGGFAPPETLEVRADPTADSPREYHYDGVTLIDNPGFQSSDSAHDENALRALSDASTIVYLFQPNLIMSDDEYMTTVLTGSKDHGVAPQQNLTFFVVNRSDELGVDPRDDLDAYRQLVRRKQSELSLALERRNITVTPDRVFCMASDPFQSVGNRTDVDASAFDPYRNWDGFRPFATVFRRIKPVLIRSGCDRSILGGGLARLGGLQARQHRAVAKFTAQKEALARLQAQIEDSIAEGTRLAAKHRVGLERLVSEHTAGLRDEVLSEQDQDLLSEKVDRLREWWKDKALHDEIERWASTAADSLNAWRERSFEAIGRRSRSMEFRAVFGDHREDVPELFTQNMMPFGGIAKSSGGAGAFLRLVNRNIVYGFGKALGFKFKPWGAVNLVGKVAKVGVVLSVAGVALDIANVVVEEKRYKKLEQGRQKIVCFLQESVPRVVETIAYGAEDDEPGILKGLESVITMLKDVAGNQSSARENLTARIGDARRKLAIYAELFSDSSNRLGTPWEVR